MNVWVKNCTEHEWADDRLPCPECYGAPHIYIPVMPKIGLTSGTILPKDRAAEYEQCTRATHCFVTSIGAVYSHSWLLPNTTQEIPVMPRWLARVVRDHSKSCGPGKHQPVANADLCGWCGRTGLETLKEKPPGQVVSQDEALRAPPYMLSPHQQQAIANWSNPSQSKKPAWMEDPKQIEKVMLDAFEALRREEQELNSLMHGQNTRHFIPEEKHSHSPALQQRMKEIEKEFAEKPDPYKDNKPATSSFAKATHCYLCGMPTHPKGFCPYNPAARRKP